MSEKTAASTRKESAASLHSENLAKRYGMRAVFREVGFELASGHAAAIVGKNGAGKSTLLRLVAGLLRPSLGRVWWRNARHENEEPGALCGLAAPDAPLYRELTALENLEFVARVRGLQFDAGALQTHLENFALGKRGADLAGDLSSGLRARLGLAVATLHSPPILLLDEPGANLDDAGRELLARVLAEQRARGIALVATNDAREAALCDENITL